jgi:hypothetical protein
MYLVLSLNHKIPQNPSFSFIFFNFHCIPAKINLNPAYNHAITSYNHVNAAGIKLNPEGIKVNPGAIKVNPKGINVNPARIKVKTEGIKLNPGGLIFFPSTIIRFLLIRLFNPQSSNSKFSLSYRSLSPPTEIGLTG